MSQSAPGLGQEVVEVKRARHTPDQIVRKLREADRLLAEGVPFIVRPDPRSPSSRLALGAIGGGNSVASMMSS